jgi:hypothetical protein
MLEKIKNSSENKAPISYEDWINLGRVIIPCVTKQAVVEKWSDPDFKITKEEWKAEHSNKQIGLRLDQYIDFDIDNPVVRRFVFYIKSCGAIFGRKNNPQSHYLWKGSLKAEKYTLPKELENYYKEYSHGATLCEIRHDIKQYTLVPETKYHSTNETIKWVKYDDIEEYQGNLKIDIGKIALSAALCIIYAGKGQRDEYCTAIAGVLLKHTDWNEEDINDFVYQIAKFSKDEEYEKRKNKGTSHKKANRKLGIPKLAEIIGCSAKTIGELFSWIGIKYRAGKEIAQESIGEIIEYGSDRYIVKVNGIVDGELKEKEIIVTGPTLMNQKLFYDAVISKASVWIPKMKPNDFEAIMRRKFETRSHSNDYVNEAEEDQKFIKNFNKYIKLTKVFTEKKELANYGLPYFNQKTNNLHFNLNKFEDYLTTQRINMDRVDLCLKIQRILKGEKDKGKFEGKSCVSWKINQPELDKEDIILEGQAVDINETPILEDLSENKT